MVARRASAGLALALLVTLLVTLQGAASAQGERAGTPAGFDLYPYRTSPGYWRFAPEEGVVATWSLRPRWEYGTDFDDLARKGLGLEVEHARGFGLDAWWSRFVEDRAGPDAELDLGDANLVYRFAESPRAAFRAGLGINVLDDSSGTDLGVNATAGARFLPLRPLTAGLELDLGTLAGDGLVHVRGELGLVLHRFELFATADHFDVDGDELESFGCGLRAWF